METIFDICCGSGDEDFKTSGFVAAGDDDFEDQYSTPRKQQSREKAAVALELKRSGRESIFSSPVDVTCSWNPPVFEKTASEADFLRTTMKGHLLFEELCDKELQILIDTTEKVELGKGEKVVRQHVRGEYLFIVQKGQLDSYCEIGKHRCGAITKGDFFGELSLLYGKDYPLSVIVDEDSILWRMEQASFRNVVARHAHSQDADIISHLRKVDLFQSISETTLQKISDLLTQVRFKEGDAIVKKGEPGEIFYVIDSGAVRVHDIGIGDSQSSEHTLIAGDSFGERSLLTGEPRAASITALSDVVTLAMDRETFERSLGELQARLDHKAKVQSLRSLPIFASGDLTDMEFQSLADQVTEVCYSKGAKLARAGIPYPKKVWFIRKGQVIVYGKKSENIYNLLSGDYFGEKSILGDPDHVSSHEAVCEDNVTAWVLSREDIEAVIINLHRLGHVGGYVKVKQHNSSIRGLRDVKKRGVLGKGGFGKVWLVEHEVSQKPYALKVINKRRLLDAKQERSVLREQSLLELLHHPFILDMVASFQDATSLYLILPVIQGGELFSVVAVKSKSRGGLRNNDASFYAAGIIEGLGHFHHRHIAYRDMKLENVMIDADGYPKIVDLGFSKVIVDKSYTFCGTPDYLAPEIIMSKGHNHAVDYWSFGVLVYEMLVGRSPFSKVMQSQMDMFKRIVLVQYECPALMSKAGQDLITKLLVRPVTGRLGMQCDGHHDIMRHQWFVEAGIDFKRLIKKQIDAPWKPEVKDPFDVSNFDVASSLNREVEDHGRQLSKAEQAVFKDF